MQLRELFGSQPTKMLYLLPRAKTKTGASSPVPYCTSDVKIIRQWTALQFLYGTLSSALVIYGHTVHSSGGYMPAFYRGDPGSLSGRSVWDLWLIEWHSEWFFSESLGFSLSLSSHCCSIATHGSSIGCTLGPLAAAVPQTCRYTCNNLRCIYNVATNSA